MSEREILFRGKKKNGEWIKGSLLKANFEGEDYNFIFGDKFDFTDDGGMKALSHALVIHETVGQYTGLKDKNGTRIFEGDVMKYAKSSQYIRYLNHVRFAVSYDSINARFAVERYVNGGFEGTKKLTAFNPSEHLEVIGNIYDNPELLKGDNNDKQKP